MRSLAFSLLALILYLVAAPRGSVASDQPLANVAIHHASIELDSSAYIEASPYVLGQKGEDTEWVTVEFFSSQATSSDWIGVFSPGNFNSSICPDAGQNPDICTAPIKYQLANYSEGYVGTGKGSIKFQLINQRSDFSFALFTGGLSKPSLIAVSNVIAFGNPKAPLYPRLAQGKEWNEMTVTWTSGYDISEGSPFVLWGMHGSLPTRTPARTDTVNRESLCGEPARTVGWRDPGFIHTSFLTDLRPNEEYYYKVGHQLNNGTIVYGKPYNFKASPFPGQNSLQRVVIFGDMGKVERDGSNEYNNYQPGSLTTTDALVKDLDNIDIIFHIGDIAYANGYLSQWDQFTAQMEPLTAKVPYMLAIGNHERDWPNSGSFYTGIDSGGECGVLAETMYYVPTENRDNYWYQTDYGMFRFCIVDTEHDWREGTEQYKFIEKCLSTVDRKKQPWLIFLAHRVLGYSSGSIYAKGYAEPMGRETFEPLFNKYSVNIAFFGHVHNYERTCPVFESQCVSTEKSHYSGTMNGTIHIVAGGGGCCLTGFSNPTPVWSIYRDVDFGFTKLTAFNHSSLLFEYKRSSDGNVYDSFTINRNVQVGAVDRYPPKTFEIFGYPLTVPPFNYLILYSCLLLLWPIYNLIHRFI